MTAEKLVKWVGRIILILVTALITAAFVPMFFTAGEKLTVKTPEACEELGGEYASGFVGPAHCFGVENGRLIDYFNAK